MKKRRLNKMVILENKLKKKQKFQKINNKINKLMDI